MRNTPQVEFFKATSKIALYLYWLLMQILFGKK